MGQQQLLLVVLGIIVVGISIGIANQLFDTHAEEANKDSIASELNHLAMLAQQYYSKPINMGGGNFDFTGWQIPAFLDSTTSGAYTIVRADQNELVLNGIPFSGKGYNWYMQSTVKKEGITTQVLN